MSEERYCNFNELVLGHQRLRSFRVSVDAAIRVADFFDRLHKKDGCVRFFAMEDLLINPENGQIEVVHGDVAETVSENNQHRRQDIRYTSPEVIAGRRDPDQFSDRYLLSILIFQLLTGGVHPLAGKRSVCPVMSREMKLQQYGTNPLFMFDPMNEDNGPDLKLHREAKSVWGILPDKTKKLFLLTFGEEGFWVPGTRPTASDWMETLVEFQNQMIPCDCGNILLDNGENRIQCAKCGNEIPISFRIETGGTQIPAVRGNRIYFRRLDDEESWNPEPIACMVVSQNDLKRLGIQNISGESWMAITSKGKPREVKADEVIPLKDGIMCQHGEKRFRINEMRHVGEK